MKAFISRLASTPRGRLRRSSAPWPSMKQPDFRMHFRAWSYRAAAVHRHVAVSWPRRTADGFSSVGYELVKMRRRPGRDLFWLRGVSRNRRRNEENAGRRDMARGVPSLLSAGTFAARIRAGPLVERPGGIMALLLRAHRDFVPPFSAVASGISASSPEVDGYDFFVRQHDFAIGRLHRRRAPGVVASRN